MNDAQTLSTGLWILIIVIGLWSAVWKGLALWRSAKLGHKVWFIVMFIINTAGILEIIYLLTHRGNKKLKVEIEAPKIEKE